MDSTFLRDLSPARTAYLYWLCLGLSVLAVAINWRNRWAWVVLPASPIFVYGLLLWIAQRRHFVAHSPSVKNSPYVLGFVMTLVALFSLFFQAGGELATGTVDADFLIGQAGAAISTSVVGLLWRQVLYTADPNEAQQEDVFKDLAKRLREHSLQFDKSQRSLVAMIQDFVKAREELFSREEVAFQKFVTGLEGGAQLLKQIETTFPTRLARVAEAFETGLTKLNSQVGASAQALTELTESGRSATAAVGQTSSEVVGSLRGAVAGWQGNTKMLAESLGQHNATLQGSIQNASIAQAQLGAALQSFAQSLDRLRALPDQITSTLNAATTESLEMDSQVKQRLNAMLEDVKAMDAVIDEVSKVLVRRLEIAG